MEPNIKISGVPSVHHMFLCVRCKAVMGEAGTNCSNSGNHIRFHESLQFASSSFDIDVSENTRLAFSALTDSSGEMPHVG
jgi:hypothetical protein